MSVMKSELYAQALKLSASERLNLATELLDSVEGDDNPAWDTAWLAELDRRMDEAERDPSSLRPWATVKRTILNDLGHR